MNREYNPPRQMVSMTEQSRPPLFLPAPRTKHFGNRIPINLWLFAGNL